MGSTLFDSLAHLAFYIWTRLYRIGLQAEPVIFTSLKNQEGKRDVQSWFLIQRYFFMLETRLKFISYSLSIDVLGVKKKTCILDFLKILTFYMKVTRDIPIDFWCITTRPPEALSWILNCIIFSFNSSKNHEIRFAIVVIWCQARHGT